MRQGLRSLVSSLPAAVRLEAEAAEVVNDAMWHVDEDIRGKQARPRASAHEPTSEDVAAVQQRFKGMVISEIDKERGELAIL